MGYSEADMSTICTTCKGMGQTKECRTIVLQVEPKVWKTKHLGSGCLTCLGTGIIGERTLYRRRTPLTDHYPQHIIDAVNAPEGTT